MFHATGPGGRREFRATLVPVHEIRSRATFPPITRRPAFQNMSNLQARLDALSPQTLKGIGRGIEKESLRATPEGSLAMTPHPQALGSALTHPHITTDYSE